MARNIQWYGWKRDTPDIRDFKYSAPRAVLEILPASVDLTPQCPPVYDQGAIGSCTANAIGAAHQFEQEKQDANKDFIPSRLFIYYNERDMEGSVDYDSGAEIRDGIKSVVKQGACPESQWIYDISHFRTKPSDACYTEALLHQVLTYWSVTQSLEQMKGCLASGYPFVFGFTVYDSFESDAVAKSGELQMPAKGEGIVGGHAVMAVGYDDATQRFVVRNSWGDDWGMKGYFTMPYEYISNPNLASDFWTIRMVEVSDQPIPAPTPMPTPTPSPQFPCDMSLLFPATKAFVDGAVKASNMTQSRREQSEIAAILGSGFKELQEYLQRVEAVRNRQK
jgi:C1A family cysteine protease